jgi:predicted nucleotidyltransferase
VPGKFYVINEMLNFCDSILLFGSYANDNFEENSDLDLVLVNCNNKEAIKKIKNREVMEINEHYVSYLDFKKSLKNKNNLAIEILKNHILFGNVSKIVEYYIEDGKR